ncbi:MAG: glutathione S-transferase family protein [Alphaproteobacteria bacterium]|nr:glutathione S-transferase family protein [Alphaproteobacteria bacterium]
MIKLYGRAGTGAAAVEALLHELEVPHEYIEVATSKDDPSRSDPAFTAINPLGQVPFILCDDGTVMAESGAIIIAAADRFGRNSLVKHDLYIPMADDPTRNSYMRWIMFFASGVYYHHLFYFYSGRYVSAPVPQAELKVSALRELDRLLNFAAGQLGNQPYLLGDDCSPLDLYAAMLFAWHPDLQRFINDHPIIKAYCHRVMNRPKAKKTWEKHGLFIAA